MSKEKEKNEFSKLLDDDFEIPQEILDLAEKYAQNLLPKKSKERYDQCYHHLMQWMTEKKVHVSEESVMLAYFGEQSKKYAPSTVWSQYLMIKSTLNINHDVKLEQYKKLKAFLRQNYVGYKPKKSKILTAKVETFLNEAPDHSFLLTKVILILGVMGALRRKELRKIKLDHVKNKGDMRIVDVPDTKNKVSRRVIIDGDFCLIVKKYMALRPMNIDSTNFFLRYHDGKCVNQVVGNHKFGQMPHKIATYLNVDDADDYRGHSLRRTSAALLSEGGADANQIMQHGGWKSDTVARGYVESTIYSRAQISERIRNSITLQRFCRKITNNVAQEINTSAANPSTSTKFLSGEELLQDAQDTMLKTSSETNCSNDEKRRGFPPQVIQVDPSRSITISNYRVINIQTPKAG